MFALAAELRRRGHRVTFFQMLDLEERVRDQGFDFVPLGLDSHPTGSLSESLTQLSRLRGSRALRFTVSAIEQTTEMICSEAPGAIKRAQIDLLLVDQTEPAGGAVADHLGLPFITICNALLLNREAGVPPPFTPWMPRDGALARVRNRLGYAASDYVLRRIGRLLASYRKKWRLPQVSGPDQLFSRLAQVSQQTPGFEFPRKSLPGYFRFTGPFRQSTDDVGFPWEKLDGRPLAYASLGTLQNRNFEWFEIFARACSSFDVQLVISHNHGLAADQVSLLSKLSKNALVVDYAPQQKLLSRACLTITHAGLNTVLDSLSCGVPLVCVPITYEQPAIAARVKWTGTGQVVSPRSLSVAAIQKAIAEAFESDAGEAAKRIQAEIQFGGGSRAAVDCIETVLRGKPLESEDYARQAAAEVERS